MVAPGKHYRKKFSMKYRIFTGWNFMRVLRLVLGCAIVWQAAASRQWPIVIVGTLLVLLALLNAGLCGVSCFTRPQKAVNINELKDDITYEEVK